MSEVMNEEKLSPYFCSNRRCQKTFMLIWTEAIPDWPYKCPYCGKPGRTMSVIFYGKIRIEELPENKYLTYKEYQAADRRKRRTIQVEST